MSEPRLVDCIPFLQEVDKLKSVERLTKLIGRQRCENAAEHSWHVALMAMVLNRFANSEVDLLRVITMLLVHDLAEVYAGDTFLHDANRDTAHRQEKERCAAAKLFGLLPEPISDELHQLWREFEEKNTPESRFAEAVDRFQPLLHNFLNKGGDWLEYLIPFSDVVERNHHIVSGSSSLWTYVLGMLDCARRNGTLAD